MALGDHLTLLRLYKSYRENVKDKHWLASRPINKRSFQHALVSFCGEKRCGCHLMAGLPAVSDTVLDWIGLDCRKFESN